MEVFKGLTGPVPAMVLFNLLCQFPAVIDLNVGGRHFTTHLSTLTKEPDSMLTAMFSGRHPVSKDKDGRFFIDADGDIFYHILNFLRFERPPPSDLLLPLYEQARYFGLQSLVSRLEVYIPVKQEKSLEKLRSLYPIYSDILNRSGEEINKDPFDAFKSSQNHQLTLRLDPYVVFFSENETPCENCQRQRVQMSSDFLGENGFRYLLMEEFAKRNLTLEVWSDQCSVYILVDSDESRITCRCPGRIMSFVVSPLFSDVLSQVRETDDIVTRIINRPF